MTIEVQSVLDDPDLKNIYLKMVDYLSQGDMSERRLVERILRLPKRYPTTLRYKKYSRENVWKLMPLIRERGYINEQRYAENLFQSLQGKRDGSRLIRRKMLNRQIPAEIVDQVLNKFKDAAPDLSRIIAEAAKKLAALHRKYDDDPVKRYQVNQRLYAWLAMRGFSSEEMAKIRQKATALYKK